MKTIQYECRPGQLRSTIYQVLVFINEENKALMERVAELTYDPDFSDYNRYQFYPVHREKWAGSPDAPQNLRTLLAQADVLVRCVPTTEDKDVFMAGFFEHADDFDRMKKELYDFVEKAFDASCKNYYPYLAEQVSLRNEMMLDVYNHPEIKEYINKIGTGDLTYVYAGELIDKLLNEDEKESISQAVEVSLGGSYENIQRDVKLILNDFDFTSDSYAPKFQVVIHEKLKREKGVSGKYDIYLKRNGELDEEELFFSTKHAKALYIYFLIHASERFIKDQIDKTELTEIYFQIYGVRDEIENRIADKKNDRNEKFFDAFIKDTKPSVNRTVQAALKGVYDYSKMKTEENKKKPFRDAEKWYIIQVDDDKQYFVSLPKDCVEVPESLLKEQKD
jgi:hypothetical protein